VSYALILVGNDELAMNRTANLKLTPWRRPGLCQGYPGPVGREYGVRLQPARVSHLLAYEPHLKTAHMTEPNAER
jgi:hypothetical protein